MSRPPTPVLTRLLAKVSVPPAAWGCWTWTGGDNGRGYGSIGMPGGKRKYVHRVSYEELVGPIPDGLELDHLCGVRRCVNPAHLEPVTHAENVRRAETSQPVLNAAKTHCDSGHPFDDANTYVRPDGYRDCRRCKADAAANHRSRAARQLVITGGQ